MRGCGRAWGGGAGRHVCLYMEVCVGGCRRACKRAFARVCAHRGVCLSVSGCFGGCVHAHMGASVCVCV